MASLVFSLCTLVAIEIPNQAVRAALLGAGPFSVFGGYFGWYYLRFVNRNSDGSVGDVSDDFALIVLFPDWCRCVAGVFELALD